MGEQTRFRTGQKAPNDGVYIEVGVNDHHMGIEDPRRVELKKGDKFPILTNDDRQWVLERKNQSVH